MGCPEKKSNLFIDQYAQKHYNAIPVKVDDPQRIRRDVREAEGARLEIVCAVNSGTEGSNPSLSATRKKLKIEYLRSAFGGSILKRNIKK